jgi:hypothetical protein
MAVRALPPVAWTILRARLLQDRHAPRVAERRLEDQVPVGVHRALDDRLAEAPGGADDDHAREAAFRVDREHDAGAAEVRPDHRLHPDGERDLRVWSKPSISR